MVEHQIYNTCREVMVEFDCELLSLKECYDKFAGTEISYAIIAIKKGTQYCYTAFKEVGFFTLPIELINLLKKEMIHEY